MYMYMYMYPQMDPTEWNGARLVAVQNSQDSSQPQLVAVQGEQTGQDLQVNITYPDPPPPPLSPPSHWNGARLVAVQNSQDSSQPQLVAVQGEQTGQDLQDLQVNITYSEPPPPHWNGARLVAVQNSQDSSQPQLVAVQGEQTGQDLQVNTVYLDSNLAHF